jgi:hypothetical protein
LAGLGSNNESKRFRGFLLAGSTAAAAEGPLKMGARLLDDDVGLAAAGLTAFVFTSVLNSEENTEQISQIKIP